MQQSFHDGLDAATVRPLLQDRRDGPGLLRLGVATTLLLATGGLLMLDLPAWALALAVVAHGLTHVPFFAVLHESVHGTAFATRGLNRAAAWLAGFPQLSAPEGMRAFHFAHHRHTHDLAEDPELGGYEALTPWPRGAAAVLNALGLPVLLGRLAFVLLAALDLEVGWRGLLKFVPASRRAGFTRDARILLGAHLVFAVLAGFLAPRLLLLYPAMVVGHGVLSVYLACEHRGLPMEGTVLQRTRSFAGGRWVNWWMWNMPYHAEHHAWPAVPFHQLPRLHALMKERGLLVHQGESVASLLLSHGRGRRAAPPG